MNRNFVIALSCLLLFPALARGETRDGLGLSAGQVYYTGDLRQKGPNAHTYDFESTGTGFTLDFPIAIDSGHQNALLLFLGTSDESITGSASQVFNQARHMLLGFELRGHGSRNYFGSFHLALAREQLVATAQSGAQDIQLDGWAIGSDLGWEFHSGIMATFHIEYVSLAGSGVSDYNQTLWGARALLSLRLHLW
jgi:hypothetical protein